MPRGLASFLLLISTLLISSCHDSTPPPSPSSTPRLIPLSPAIASILRTLGDGPLMVGRHGRDSGSDQSLPSCGDQAGIDYETLLRVRPTDILFQQTATPPPDRLVEMATANGWRIRIDPLLALDDIRTTSLALLHQFPPPGGPPVADVEKQLIDRMDRAWSRRTGLQGEAIARAGRVLLVCGTSPQVYALGPGSWHQQILERIGGTPALTDGAPYITLDAEDCLRLRPDTIIIFAPRAAGAPSHTGPIPAASRRELLNIIADLKIPAVETGRLGLIDDPECLIPGLGMIQMADDLATLLESLGAPAH